MIGRDMTGNTSTDGPLTMWFSDKDQATEDAARSPGPSAEQDQQMWRWALSVLHEHLGTQWLQRELDPIARLGYLLLNGPADDHDSPQDAVIRVYRANNLALDLLGVQEVRGLTDLLRELQTRSLYEASAELRALNHLLEAGQGVEFRAADSKPGKSFDASVLLSGQEVAVEVKSKKDQPASAYGPKAIESTLKKARQQLPASGPSMIYLHLGPSWAADTHVMTSVDDTITQWLKRTRRVNAIIVMLERRLPLSGGGMRVWRGHYTLINESVHTPVPDLQGWSKNWAEQPTSTISRSRLSEARFEVADVRGGVRADESTYGRSIDSLSMRGAQREITGSLIQEGYAPVGRWEVEARDGDEEPVETIRRFKLA